MMRRQTLLALVLASATAASEQDAYPNKNITLMVPFAAGGSTDLVARLTAEGLSKQLGQPVIVENRPGGAAFIGTEAAARSAPDGYTMLMATDHIMCFNPALFSKLPYDPKKDFASVAGVVMAPYLLAVNADLPARSLAELVTLAKSKPGSLSFASTGVGTSSQLIGELFQAETGIKLTHVPYQSAAPLFSDLLSGTVSMCFYPYQQFQPHIQAGRLRILALATDQRWTILPDVPTFKELGLPKMTMGAFLSIVVPAGTPRDRIEKLTSAIKTVLARPEIAEPFAAVGFPTAYMTPEQLTAFTASELDRCKEIATLAGVKLD